MSEPGEGEEPKALEDAIGLALQEQRKLHEASIGVFKARIQELSKELDSVREEEQKKRDRLFNLHAISVSTFEARLRLVKEPQESASIFEGLKRQYNESLESVSGQAGPEQIERMQELEKVIENLTNENHGLRDEIRDHDDSETRVGDLKAQLEQERKRSAELQDQLREKTDEAAGLDDRCKYLEDQLEKNELDLDQIYIQRYQTGLIHSKSKRNLKKLQVENEDLKVG